MFFAICFTYLSLILNFFKFYLRTEKNFLLVEEINNQVGKKFKLVMDAKLLRITLALT